MLEIVQIPVLSDNYVYLIHEPKSGEVAIVDPAVEAEVVEELEARGWTPDYILNTHHHYDHVGANLALKQRYELKIIGPAAERERIPGLDVAVAEGDHAYLGDIAADVYDVPGHTSGHIAYHFAETQALFCGDTMFAMGCGRLFEGTPEQMWQSLSKLMRLPDKTRIYCAHEYTLANGKFALSVEPDNPALQARMEKVQALRRDGRPTVPSELGTERETNPFLRPMSDEIQDRVGLIGAPWPKVFAEVRRRKDNF
ncbi:hydroxyacylglutathione hydrolase [Kordiimonas aestuarii]|uniref:hydroxyacylglutathione hydrolase n=1 Tax=Kordiimonas aestuarii TaxID=1005925 RepID=UPI0021D1D1CA|nr:hydroxyacylglutathione hydrolase [Kordiimonas aestuarii]